MALCSFGIPHTAVNVVLKKKYDETANETKFSPENAVSLNQMYFSSAITGEFSVALSKAGSQGISESHLH